MGVALTGDLTRFTGHSRSIAYRWFMDPSTRERYTTDQHAFLGRMFASGVRAISTMRGPGSRAWLIAEELRDSSAEFRTLWDRHEVGIRPRETKRFIHPELGVMELNCQTLEDPEHSLSLLTYTATPGSESYDKLSMLAAVSA